MSKASQVLDRVVDASADMMTIIEDAIEAAARQKGSKRKKGEKAATVDVDSLMKIGALMQKIVNDEEQRMRENLKGKRLADLLELLANNQLVAEHAAKFAPHLPMLLAKMRDSGMDDDDDDLQP